MEDNTRPPKTAQQAQLAVACYILSKPLVQWMMRGISLALDI